MKEMIIYSLVIYVLAILSLIAVFLMGNFVLSIFFDCYYEYFWIPVSVTKIQEEFKRKSGK